MSRDSAACLLFLSCFFVCQTTQAQNSSPSPEGPGGTAPRASAAKYHSHAQKDGFSLGAELPSKKEASSVFAANVNRCCLLVPVAVYPKKDESIELSPFDFSLVEVNATSPCVRKVPRPSPKGLRKRRTHKVTLMSLRLEAWAMSLALTSTRSLANLSTFMAFPHLPESASQLATPPLPTSLITTAKGLNANFMKRGCRKQEFPFPWLVTCTFHFAR